jgi:CDGSH-type Zn-finger protein
MKKLAIEPIKNGPLKVISLEEKSLENILFYEETSLTLEKNSFLCRCGRTNNQPFCDGTHVKYSFNSQNDLEEEIIQVYDSKNVTVSFNRSICAGSANCVKKFPNIYTSESENWIHPDMGKLEEIIKSVEDCPSGALSYRLKDSKEDCHLESCKEESLIIIKNGPIHVRGPIDIKVEGWSSFANKTKFSLCRCGASQNKPFCDYSHAKLKDNNYTF